MLSYLVPTINGFLSRPHFVCALDCLYSLDSDFLDLTHHVQVSKLFLEFQESPIKEKGEFWRNEKQKPPTPRNEFAACTIRNISPNSFSSCRFCSESKGQSLGDCVAYSFALLHSSNEFDTFTLRCHV